MVRERREWEEREERRPRHNRYAAATPSTIKTHFYANDDPLGGQDIHGG